MYGCAQVSQEGFMIWKLEPETALDNPHLYQVNVARFRNGISFSDSQTLYLECPPP